MNYFSDREQGQRPRVETVISPAAWAGIVSLVNAAMKSGALGYGFPERCPDGQGICGVDLADLQAAVLAHIPGLNWPLETRRLNEEAFISAYEPWAPPTLLILDLTEFIWRSVARPSAISHHSYFRHDHLAFEAEAGKEDFRIQLNQIFARNGLAYEQNPDGTIHRVLPAVIADALRRPMLPTGDPVCDVLLEEARLKFSSPEPLIRREALERLFDSFERIKTLGPHQDKAKSIAASLERVSPEPTFREVLNTEAKVLTSIANTYLLRHHETWQIPLIDVDQVDYLFHRLFSLVQLLVLKNGPDQAS